MKKLKKVFAVLLSVAMILGMSSTVFAEGEDTGITTGTPNVGTPSATQKVAVKITGFPEGENVSEHPVKVTLYQIARGVYGSKGTGLEKYEWKQEGQVTSEAPTSKQINEIANWIKTPESGKVDTDYYFIPNEGASNYNNNEQGFSGSEFSCEVPAGAYIAIITGGTRVYNPLLLTAAYGTTKNDQNEAKTALFGGQIDISKAKYLWGETAVTKSNKPNIGKEVKQATEADKENAAIMDGDRATASVGQTLEYTLTPTVPSYPKDAVNKTFYVSDLMSKGLTFDFESLRVHFGNESIKGTASTSDATIHEFKTTEGKLIAKAKAATEGDKTGFRISFEYDNLINNGNGTVTIPTITYNATVNRFAVSGDSGNDNDTTLYYTNQPNQGSRYDDLTKDPDPQSDKNVLKDEDNEIIYTYRLAFLKTNDEDDSNSENYKTLEGAIFGIYATKTDAEKGENCIDEVKTDKKGYAISSQVAKGTYYVKELQAPEGYTIDETIHEITAQQTSATYKATTTVTTIEYTSKVNETEFKEQVGWLKDNVFYQMSAFSAEGDGVAKAYVKKTTTSETATENTQVVPGNATVEGNVTEGIMLGQAIKNTTLGELPSTGGIGTIIFTVGGCLIMVVAAALYFANRRRSANSESK